MLKDNKRIKEKIIKNLKVIDPIGYDRISFEKLYFALVYSLKEMLAERRLEAKKGKTHYILSSEYRAGRCMDLVLYNLGVKKEVEELVADYGYSLDELLQLEKELDSGHGSLGEMVFDRLVHLTDERTNLIAYGILYEDGYMKQDIVDNQQVEHADNWLRHTSSWAYTSFEGHEVNFNSFTIKALATDFPISSSENGNLSTLRLWRADREKVNFQLFSNGKYLEAYQEQIYKSLASSFLYPDSSSPEGKRLRFIQAYFFVQASLKDIVDRHRELLKPGSYEDISECIEIEICDVNPALAILEFIRILREELDIELDEAICKAREVYTYSQFSLLSESFDGYDIHLLEEFAPSIVELLKYLNEKIKDDLAINSQNEWNYISLLPLSGEYFHFLPLLMNIAGKIRVYSKDQIEIAKKVTPFLYERYKNKIKLSKVSFDYRSYLYRTNKHLTDLIKENIGSGYLKDIRELRELADKRKDRSFLEKLEGVKTYYKRELTKRVMDGYGVRLNHNACFIGQLGRFHEYKRQILSALYVAYCYYRIKDNTNLDIVPRVFLFGGKASSSYFMAKESLSFILRLQALINSDLLIKDKLKIVFINNLTLSDEELLYRALDINISIATPGKGLIDLSIMKAAINGSVNIVNRTGLNRSIISKNTGESLGIFGIDSAAALDLRANSSYSLLDYLQEDKEIKGLLDRLVSDNRLNRAFTFRNIYDNLLSYNDSFLVIKDLASYIRLQDKLGEKFKKNLDFTGARLDSIVLTSRLIGDDIEL